MADEKLERAPEIKRAVGVGSPLRKPWGEAGEIEWWVNGPVLEILDRSEGGPGIVPQRVLINGVEMLTACEPIEFKVAHDDVVQVRLTLIPGRVILGGSVPEPPGS